MLNIAPKLFFLSIYLIILSFLINLIITPLTNWLSLKIKLVDIPGERKIHKTPVPMSGGISILFAISIIILLHSIIYCCFSEYITGNTHLSFLIRDTFLYPRVVEFISLSIGAFFIWSAGVIDDFFKNPKFALFKFIFQIISAAIIVFPGNTHITFFQPIIISQILSIIWIVGVINSFNMLDNMDGLCGGIATICSAVLMGIAIWHGQIIIAIVSAVLIGILIAFLIFNFNPAKIFLGDNGAMLIGYIMAILTLRVSYLTPGVGYFFPILIPVIILAIPLVDTFSVIIIRLKQKKPIYVGDTNHISHRLLKTGLSTRRSVLLIYLLTFSSATSGILLLKADIWFSLLILLQSSVTILIFLLLMKIGKKRDSV